MVNRIKVNNVSVEDKMFMELMDQIMMIEGEHLLDLNEKLKSNSRFSIPKDINVKCLNIKCIRILRY